MENPAEAGDASPGQKRRTCCVVRAGFALFATTDIYFLIASATTGYPFASIIDDGWLLGLICIAEAFYHRPKPIIISDLWSSFTTTASLILATIILATAALHPSAFVAPVIAVAIATSN